MTLRQRRRALDRELRRALERGATGAPIEWRTAGVPAGHPANQGEAVNGSPAGRHRPRRRGRPLRAGNTDARYYDGEWLNKRQRSMHISILNYSRQYDGFHARSRKEGSRDSVHKKYRALATMMLKELRALGYEPTSLAKLKKKHIVALLRAWERQGLTGGTMQNKFSILSQVCKRLRKNDCLPERPEEVLDDPSRYRVRTVACTEKAVSTHCTDIETLLAKLDGIDPVIGLQVRAMLVYGLRSKEAARLSPHSADKGDHLLITDGTKGGRPRVVSLYDYKADYDDAAQEVVVWDVKPDPAKVELLERMKRLARPGRSLIPVQFTLAQWRRRLRAAAEQCGLTEKELGTTLHGLRHEYICRQAEKIGGLPRALRRIASLTPRQVRRDRVARQLVALDAGHHDTYTTETYYGPRLEQAPKGLVKRIAQCVRGPVREPLFLVDASGRVTPGKGRRIRIVDGLPDWQE